MGTFTVNYFVKKAIWEKKGYWLASVAVFYFGRCWDSAGMAKAEMMKGHSRMYASRIASVPTHTDPWKHGQLFAGLPIQPQVTDSEEDRESERSGDTQSEEHADTYEPDEQLVRARLTALYPALAIRTAQEKIQLPTRWNPEDKARYLSLSQDGLRISHKSIDPNKAPPNTSNASAVRANFPVPPVCGVYYFEITVKDSPTGCLGIGICQKSVNTNRLPGWDPFSYGYHGDDGHFFSSSGNGTQYGEKFGTGDTVGCGVNLIENHIFFTKNGAHQGVAMEGLELGTDLYPVIGMQSPHEKVDTNFGQRPFVYDIQEIMANARGVVRKQIDKVEMALLLKRDWCHRIVANFLQTEGFSQSFLAFNRYINEPAEEPADMIQGRRRIMNLIVTHKCGDAMQMIRTYFPQMMTGISRNRRQAMLLLKIQQFVETAYLFVTREERKSTTNGSFYSNGNSHPSTSGEKRNLAQNSDHETASRKHLPGRISVGSRLEQPCSSKNGSANGNGVAFHDDLDEKYNGNHHVGRRYCPDDYDKMGELIQLGREIAEEAQSSDFVNDYLLSLVEDALPCIYMGKNAFRNHRLRRNAHLVSVAKKVNSAIIESFHEETGLRGMRGLTLNQVVDAWKEKKQQMLDQGCPTVAFVEDKEIIFSRFDDDGESDTTDDSDLEDNEGSGSSETEESDEELDDEDGSFEEGSTSSSGDEEDDSESLESDQPTHSRALIAAGAQ